MRDFAAISKQYIRKRFIDFAKRISIARPKTSPDFNPLTFIPNHFVLAILM